MPEVAQATIVVTPVLEGAQQSLTEQLTSAGGPAGDAAGQESGSRFAGTFTKSLIGGTAAVTTAVVGVGAAMVGAAGKTAAYGDQIDKASQKLGVSSSFYQEWDAVLQHSGTSMSSMTGTFKKLATASQDASDDQVAAFEALGLSMDQVANMSTEDLFASVISGLQGMEEGTERTNIATQLLGKGAMEMGALFNTSAEDTQAMIDRVNELGGVMDEQGVKSAAAYQDALQDMQTAFTGVGNGLMGDLLPPMTDFMNKLADFIGNTDLSPVTDTIGAAVEALGNFIANLDIEAAGEAFGVAVEGIGAAVGLAWDVISTIFDSLQAGFETITESLDGVGIDWGDVWSGISDAVQTAADIVGGIIEAICEVIGGLLTAVQEDGTLINAAWENMQTSVSAACELIQGALNLVKDLLNGDWSAAWEDIQGIVETCVTAMQTICENTWNAITTLATTVWEGIQSAISGPVETAKSAIETAWDTVQTKCETVWTAVQTLATTTWESIKTAISGPVETAKDAVTGAWDAVQTKCTEVFDAVYSKVSEVFTNVQNFLSPIVDWLKGIFDFEWSLPELKLPHIVVGSYIEVPVLGTIPDPTTLRVDWYAKGAIFDNASLIGVGEAGREGIIPLEGGAMRPFAHAIAKEMAEKIGGGDITINVYPSDGMDVNQLARKVADEMEFITRQRQRAWSMA